MGYPSHYLLQFGGSVGSPEVEVWSCGIRIVLDGSPLADLDESDYLAEQGVPLLAAWFARPTSKISAIAKLKYAKFNLIAEDGTYVKPVTTEYFWPTPIVGGVTWQGCPFQATAVLSWETNEASRGLASKGRIYSPVPSVSIGQSGLFPAADALAMAGSAATLISGLQVEVDATTAKTQPAIVSRGRMTSPGEYGEGTWNPIDTVRVDNRVDIQRKRANALVAASSQVTVVY